MVSIFATKYDTMSLAESDCIGLGIERLSEKCEDRWEEMNKTFFRDWK